MAASKTELYLLDSNKGAILRFFLTGQGYEYDDSFFCEPGPIGAIIVQPLVDLADPAARAHARWLAATMHSGFVALRASMSFNLCFLPNPPAPTPDALADAAEMLRYFEDALATKTAPGSYLFGTFCGADVMLAPAVVRLVAFRVPTDDTPRARAYLDAVLAHPGVARWMTEARALPPVAEH